MGKRKKVCLYYRKRTGQKPTLAYLSSYLPPPTIAGHRRRYGRLRAETTTNRHGGAGMACVARRLPLLPGVFGWVSGARLFFFAGLFACAWRGISPRFLPSLNVCRRVRLPLSTILLFPTVPRLVVPPLPPSLPSYYFFPTAPHLPRLLPLLPHTLYYAFFVPAAALSAISFWAF